MSLLLLTGLVFSLVVALFIFPPAIAMGLIILGIMAVFVFRKPTVFLIALFVAMPFQQSLLGASTVNLSATDCIAFLTLLVLPGILVKRKYLALGPAAMPMLMFLGVDILSSLLNWDGLSTAVSLARMVVETLLAVLIFANIDRRLSTAHKCFTFYLIAINVLAAFTILAFVQGGVQSSMSTLGINKNELGPIFGCGIVIALTLLLMETSAPKRRLWLWATLLAATVGILLSLSRGAWVATSAGCLFVFLATRNYKSFIIAVLVLIPVVAGIWSLLPQEAQDYASNVSTKAHTIQTRFYAIDIVMDSFRKSPIYGVGIGLRKDMEPHDVIVLTLGETGVVGLIGFLGMFVGGFYTFRLAARFARSNPQAMQIIVAGAAVLLVSIVHGTMDVYWRRGVGFMGWCAVGMAVNIIQLGRVGYFRKPQANRQRIAA